jgi:pimeloyl-ACP methyl ester carboxylesterase
VTKLQDMQFLFLHGLGATGGVWKPLQEQLEKRTGDAGHAPDLPGHGDGEKLDRYDMGDVAACVSRRFAPLADQALPMVIVGHSYGGVVALTLASHWFALKPAMVFSIGIKARWTEEEIAIMKKLAARQAKYFPTEEEALGFYYKVAGISPDLTRAIDAQTAVVQDQDGWRLAQDPKTNDISPPPMAALCKIAAFPVHLARGEYDAMTPLDDLLAYDPQTCNIEGGSHNAMIDAADGVLDWISDHLENAFR